MLDSDIATTTAAKSKKRGRGSEKLALISKNLLKIVNILNPHVEKQPEIKQSSDLEYKDGVEEREYMKEFEELEDGPRAVFPVYGESATVGGEMVRCVSNLIRGPMDEADIKVSFNYLETFGKEFSRKLYITGHHVAKRRLVKKLIIYLDEQPQLYNKVNTIDYQNEHN